MDADVEDMHPAASIAVYASTLAERRATSAELRGVHARDIAERLHKSKLSSPHALRRLALSGSDGALSDASRLPEPECVDLGELASIELRGDPDAVLRGEGTVFTAPHGVFLRREKLDAGTDFEDAFETHHPEGMDHVPRLRVRQGDGRRRHDVVRVGANPFAAVPRAKPRTHRPELRLFDEELAEEIAVDPAARGGPLDPRTWTFTDDGTPTAAT